MSIPFTKTKSTLTVVIGGKPYTMQESNPNYKAALRALKNEDEDELLMQFDIASKVANATSNNLTINRDGTINFLNERIPVDLQEAVIGYVRDGLNVQPLLKFLDKLMLQTSFGVRNQLFRFISLNSKYFCISDEGNLLGYKSVRPDYTDWHTGKFYNTIGARIFMDRPDVDDNPDVECSQGFHFASYDYAYNFQNQPGRHLMLIECDPRDVVSVPKDCNHQKLRVCSYWVVDELKEHSKPLPKSNYTIHKDKNGLKNYNNHSVRDPRTGRFVRQN